MKYVVMRDEETGEIISLGRFHENALTERYSIQGFWISDNTLESDLFDGLLEEISETEAIRLIATQFSCEKQAA
jgi:hypothetical protein